MKNIIDYIHEYGNREFDDLPFNEVDALILSQFSYFRWDNIIPDLLDDSEGIPLIKMAKKADPDHVYKKELYPLENEKLLNAMLETKRFREMVCNFYTTKTNEDVQIQFAAFTCFLKGSLPVIVFRGTDGTVVGWREDFNMAFSRPVAGQRLASLYVNQVALRIKGDFIVAGHSKGGNLAAFSAMSAVKGVRERIREIYSFDGPGFRKEILEEYDYKAVSARIKKYMPESSIVGILLEGTNDYITVKSRAVSGALQHNPYSWEVKDYSFETAKAIKRSSVIMHRSMNSWVMELDERQLGMFVDTLFDVISASGAKDIPQIASDKKNWVMAVRKAAQNLDEDKRENFINIMKELFDAVYKNR